MHFSDIPKLTAFGEYEVQVPLRSVPRTLAEYIQEYGLQMDPKFQRAHVWGPLQRSRYVEYLLRDGHSSRVIYFNCYNWRGRAVAPGPMLLVDGKQRLSAVLGFLDNRVTAFGKLFREFQGPLPSINGLQFHVNYLETYSEVLRWYLDLNEGGVAHTEKELNKVRAELAKGGTAWPARQEEDYPDILLDALGKLRRRPE
jgi:hypothetical protein